MGKILEISGVENFKNIRALVLTAMMISLAVICNGLLRIEVIPNVLHIVFGFLFIAVVAFLFGPAMGFAAGFIASVITFLFFPPAGASFNPLFDLNRGLAGAFYGLFLFRRNPNSEYFIIWIVAVRVTVRAVCYLLINTSLMVLMGIIHGDAAGAWMAARLVTNIVALPVDILLMFTILKFVQVVAQRYKFTAPAKILKKEGLPNKYK